MGEEERRREKKREGKRREIVDEFELSWRVSTGRNKERGEQNERQREDGDCDVGVWATRRVRLCTGASRNQSIACPLL